MSDTFRIACGKAFWTGVYWTARPEASRLYESHEAALREARVLWGLDTVLAATVQVVCA